MMKTLVSMHRAAALRLRSSQLWRTQSTWAAHSSVLPTNFQAPTPLPGQHRSFSTVRSASSQEPLVDAEYEEVEFELPTNCPGCGVRLQDEDAHRPGFFQVPRRVIDMLSNPVVAEDEEEEEELEDVAAAAAGAAAAAEAEEGDDKDGSENEGENWGRLEDLVESWLDTAETKSRRSGDAPPRPKSFQGEERGEEDLLNSILCARCYSLRHYGRVKSDEAEGLLPGFDFERAIGRKIALQKFRRSVVLAVVDMGDFDGSLPRAAIRSLMPSETRAAGSSMAGKLPPTFRLVVVANKSDLLPSAASKMRLEAWVRRRMAQGGLPRPSAVHIVSSLHGRGVRSLLADLQAAVGSRGDVWVVGAQNAGKSSLLNSMRTAVGLSDSRTVTVAPLPGTTLGLTEVPSLLPKGCKMMDTPGVPHEYQLAAYMTAEEMKTLLPRRPLKPRTYRIAAGQSVTLGGVARVDVEACPGATMYLTVWVSDEVACHMGKTDGAEERYAKHAGTRLVPPVGGEERMETFPQLQRTLVEVEGGSWRESSVDVAIAGLGWVAVGLDGQAKLQVWAPPGVAVTTRDAMLPDFAKDLERPGFGAVVAPSAERAGKSGGSGGKKGKAGKKGGRGQGGGT